MFDHLPQGRWWDRGLQLVEGCTKVSPGCDNCWSLTAANMRRFNPNPKVAGRYEGVVDYHLASLASPDQQCRECQAPQFECEGPCRPQWTGQVRPQWQDLDKIGRARTPQVYTFWNDLFHTGVPDEFVDAVIDKIHENIWRQKIRTGDHFFIICTKRPERALIYFSSRQHIHGFKNWLNRLMIMTSAENQEMAGLRLPFLLQIPGVMHGVSVEPGLGLVDLEKIQCWDDRFGFVNHSDFPATLDWVICGGETGPHARPMHPDIPRKLRDDCVAAGVPFFFKSWGEWQEGSAFRSKALCVYNDGRTVEFSQEAILAEEQRSGIHHQQAHPTLMTRTGKKAAGLLLDGRTWDEVPR